MRALQAQAWIFGASARLADGRSLYGLFGKGFAPVVAEKGASLRRGRR